ncbi:MAG: transporter permease, partial [Sphingomonas bacterium]|uniref:MFS transporter n=1 Tax=Sphingomonas bacterium TaxID=1895847 RepID=UPI002624981D
SPHEHTMVNDGERATITAALGTFAKGKRKVPWGQILSNPQIWLLSAMYFCYGYDIGVFLSWFPKYLKEVHHLNLTQMGIYASLPLFAGLIGDISGGMISDHLLKRTGKLKFSRRIVSFIGFALSSVAVTMAAHSADPMISIAWFCLAVFGLELTVGVSWAVTLDVGGEFAGSVSAVMNTLGNIGAALAIWVTARVLWGTAFDIIAALALAAAVLCLTVDASRRLYKLEPAAE